MYTWNVFFFVFLICFCVFSFKMNFTRIWRRVYPCAYPPYMYCRYSTCIHRAKRSSFPQRRAVVNWIKIIKDNSRYNFNLSRKSPTSLQQTSSLRYNYIVTAYVRAYINGHWRAVDFYYYITNCKTEIEFVVLYDVINSVDWNSLNMYTMNVLNFFFFFFFVSKCL